MTTQSRWSRGRAVEVPSSQALPPGAVRDFLPYWPSPSWRDDALVCEHCGCGGVEPVRELMDEHFVLLDLASEVRRQLGAGQLERAWHSLGQLADLLTRHVRREEAGIFAALKDQGDFADAVEELEGEHAHFDDLLSTLDRGSPTLAAELEALFAELSEHIDKENLGIFPVAVVTLGATGWDTVSRAHEELPFG